jgi:hypothetical protein
LVSTEGFRTTREITGSEYSELMKKLVGKPVIWTDNRVSIKDKFIEGGIGSIQSEYNSQSVGDHCHVVNYQGKKYAWWDGAYMMVLVSDKCGDCTSGCRREQGKCGLYTEMTV